MPAAFVAVMGAPRVVVSGSKPAHKGRMMSSSSSEGSPVRAFAETLSKLNSTISVAADSFSSLVDRTPRAQESILL